MNTVLHKGPHRIKALKGETEASNCNQDINAHSVKVEVINTTCVRYSIGNLKKFTREMQGEGGGKQSSEWHLSGTSQVNINPKQQR